MAATGGNGFKSREDFRRAKELEEERKAGRIPPEKDEDGKDINPHMPQFISRAPFYLKQEGPSLKHQKKTSYEASARTYDGMESWYARGQSVGKAATKYRKGACENCGSKSHRRKDCVERPRAKGARWTGRDIAADEEIRAVNLDFEGKRDRWNGYDAREYDKVIASHERLEEERRKVRAAQVEKKLGDSGNTAKRSEEEELDADEDGEFKQKDDGEVIMQQKDEGTRVAVRNLRIREDTAKYLRNLDVESAFYDPKTRSMRQDPNPQTNPEDKDYAGDNFVRVSGDVRELAGIQLHAIRAEEENRELPHLLAEPSRAEAVFKEFKTKKETAEDQRKKSVLEKYGGEEHFVKPQDMADLQQSESFVEYSRDGRVIRGVEPPIPKTKYAEDILENNHTSVWGSYYTNGQWGYQCCHQTTKRAYCTGETGKIAAREAKTVTTRIVEKPKEDLPPVAPDGKQDKGKNKPSRAELIQKAVIKQKKEDSKFVVDDRKRRFNAMAGDTPDEVTEEEMEAYKLRRSNPEDPMRNFV